MPPRRSPGTWQVATNVGHHLPSFARAARNAPRRSLGTCQVAYGFVQRLPSMVFVPAEFHREQSIPRSSARPSEARFRRAKRGPAERSEARAVNRALRARIRRKLEAVKQEATQLPRLNCLGRRGSVLSTYVIKL